MPGLSMNAPPLLELPLDDNLLKVLSSDSRREILRALAERRMTGAELAARLQLGKPAVSEHLKKLVESQLIERFDDDERRWVYYGLTARGRSILEPQRVRFYLVLGVAIVGLLAGIAITLGIVALVGTGGSGLLAAGEGEGHSGSGLAGAADPSDGSGVGLPDVRTAPGENGTGAPTRPARNVVPEGPDQMPDAPAQPETGAALPPSILILGRDDPLPVSLQGRVVLVQSIDARNQTVTLLVPQPGADLNQTLAAAGIALANGTAFAVPAAGIPLGNLV
jgi:DNA-binding transcriptional ArsR family regulator